MEEFITKQESELYKALQFLLTKTTDGFGNAKKPTLKQWSRAKKAITNYNNYEREFRVKNKIDHEKIL